MTKSVEEVVLETRNDVRELQDKLTELRNDLSRIVPNDDYEGLGMYLRLLIEKEQRRKAFQQALIEKGMLALVYGLIAWTITAMWEYLKHELRK